jgi:hypothetical protein
MEVEALRIRGVDELAADSGSLEDPFDVAAALIASGKANHIAGTLWPLPNPKSVADGRGR